MADAYARTTGRVAAVTVHQGCGLTNALTGIVEAAKSRTPLLVLAADTADLERALELPYRPARRAARSRRPLGVDHLAGDRGPGSGTGLPPRLRRPAHRRPQPAAGRPGRRSAAGCAAGPAPSRAGRRGPRCPVGRAAGRTPPVGGATGLHRRPRRPALGRAGRADRPRRAQRRPAGHVGRRPRALRRPRVVHRRLGRFRLTAHGRTGQLGRSGRGLGRLAQRLDPARGELVAPGATVVQVDDDGAAIGTHLPVDLGVVGDVRVTAEATAELLRARPRSSTTWRTRELRERIATGSAGAACRSTTPAPGS